MAGENPDLTRHPGRPILRRGRTGGPEQHLSNPGYFLLLFMSESIIPLAPPSGDPSEAS